MPPTIESGPTITEADLGHLRSALESMKPSGGWCMRNALACMLHWDVRKVRAVAEQLGAEVVRCQKGFKLTALLTAQEIADAEHAVRAFNSQAKKMTAYAEALRLRLLEMASRDAFPLSETLSETPYASHH